MIRPPTTPVTDIASVKNPVQDTQKSNNAKSSTSTWNINKLYGGLLFFECTTLTSQKKDENEENHLCSSDLYVSLLCLNLSFKWLQSVCWSQVPLCCCTSFVAAACLFKKHFFTKVWKPLFALLSYCKLRITATPSSRVTSITHSS